MNKNKKLKSGDLITFSDNSAVIIGINKNGDGETIEEIKKNYGVEIAKVSRPFAYSTIYENKQILDDEEKRYLKAVIRPFKDQVIRVSKMPARYKDEFIQIELKEELLSLPYFREGTMYKNMQINKNYTLKELGLYE